MSTVIRPMKAEDGPAVAELLRRGFAHDLHPYLAYCQPGLPSFLSAVLALPAGLSDYRLWVAVQGGLVLGFAEFRSGAAHTHLSYVAVHQEARGAGVARKLVATHLASIVATSLTLDVFEQNLAACGMYATWGLRPVATSVWWRRPIEAAPPAGFGVRDWPVSVASLDRYGFCLISLDAAGADIRCGMVSRGVLRVPSDVFADDRLLAGLAATTGAHSALTIVPAEAPPAIRADKVLTSLGMSASLPLRGRW